MYVHTWRKLLKIFIRVIISPPVKLDTHKLKAQKRLRFANLDFGLLLSLLAKPL